MIEGLSRREAAKRFGVHRNTITKMLSFSVPPGYRRRERPASKKLGPHMAWIDAILEGDSQVHKKQRHTTRRIFERLRDEQGFTGGYTIVREYVAQVMLRRREMFVPLSHRPGHARADFGEVDGYIGGKGSVPLFLHGSTAFGWLFRQGVSGRNSGSLLRRPCDGIRFLRRRAEIDTLIELTHASASVAAYFDEIDRRKLLLGRLDAQRIKLFISYAHAPETETGWVGRIRTHLNGLAHACGKRVRRTKVIRGAKASRPSDRYARALKLRIDGARGSASRRNDSRGSDGFVPEMS